MVASFQLASVQLYSAYKPCRGVSRAGGSLFILPSIHSVPSWSVPNGLR